MVVMNIILMIIMIMMIMMMGRKREKLTKEKYQRTDGKYERKEYEQ